jgi:hypothetical protein
VRNQPEEEMRIAIVGTLAAAAVILAAPRHAHACGQGYGGAIVAGFAMLGVVGVDAGLLLWDAGSVIADRPFSKGYATFGIVWTVPQVALGAWATASLLSSPYNRSAAYVPALYTAAMAFTAAHAIWVIATDPGDAPVEAKPRVALGATYVPVGQMSKPALGLVGRF